MGRKSSVKDLPRDVLRQLNQLIVEGKLTLDELRAELAGWVENPPSRTALWRHASKERAAVEALKQSREIARGFAQKLGPEGVESEQGRILVEMVRSLAFNAVKDKVGDPDFTFDAKEISQIARSIRDLAQAMNLEQDFSRRIKEEAKKEAQAEMRQKLEAAANAGGLDASVANEARRILGFE